MKTKRTQPPRQQWCIDPPNLPSMQCAGTRACRVSSKQWILSPPPGCVSLPVPRRGILIIPRAKIDRLRRISEEKFPVLRASFSISPFPSFSLVTSLTSYLVRNRLVRPLSSPPRTIDYADFIGFFDYFRAIRDDLIRITSSSYLREIAAGYYRNSLKDIFSFPKSPVSNIRNGDNKNCESKVIERGRN